MFFIRATTAAMIRLSIAAVILPGAAPAARAAGPAAGFDAVHINTTNLITRLVADEHLQRLAPGEPPVRGVFDTYLSELDGDGLFFLAGDAEALLAEAAAGAATLDARALALAARAHAQFRQRVADRVATALTLLDRPLPAVADHPLGDDHERRPWAADTDQLTRRWHARIADDARLLADSGRQAQEIAPILRRRYRQLQARIDAQPLDEVYRGFVNAYLSTIDPHSGFFLPRRPRAGQRDLQGIGVQLKPQGEHTVIRRLFAGGAADSSGLLHLGDRIVAVGEGRRRPMTDVVSWPITEVVDLIRGPRGSLVRLQIMPHLKRHTLTVTLTRDRIRLEETRARKSIVDADGRRIGVITIPSFYLDYAAFGRTRHKARSTSGDVAALIRELEGAPVDGIVIDLRGNRGGDLFEAVRTTGLFIADGPVVQVRDGNGDIELHGDRDARVVYAGPLAVLVDRASASASEIFAGAIADYRRGLVVGETTFGKGTVQRTFNLNYAAGEDSSFGQLVLTVAQYYRVSGDSTQLRGVDPDVELPAAPDAAPFSERLEFSPLPWDRVAAGRFEPAGAAIDPATLRQRHRQRVERDARWREYRQAPAAESIRLRRSLVLAEAAAILGDAIALGLPADEDHGRSAIIRAP